MPFQSSAQERFMYAKHPDIAAKWQSEFGQPKDLPKHVKPMGTKMETPKVPGMHKLSPWTAMQTEDKESKEY